MDNPDIDIEAIARLVHLVESRGLDKLVVEEGGQRITIRGAGCAPGKALAAPGVQARLPAAAPSAPAAPDASAPSPDWVVLGAPMVGVFYRAGRPDAPPFVDVGDHVEVGQTIGVIEAMKVFSEIPSEHAGLVRRIVASNGDLVRPDEPLMYLSPS